MADTNFQALFFSHFKVEASWWKLREIDCQIPSSYFHVEVTLGQDLSQRSKNLGQLLKQAFKILAQGTQLFIFDKENERYVCGGLKNLKFVYS